MPDLLLELLSEEIPARMQAKARADLARLLTDQLAAAGLKADSIETYATPRRLALIARGLPLGTPAVSEELKGPRTSAPPQALEGFLRKTGLAADQLEDRGGIWFAVADKPGRATTEVLAEAIPAIIRAFPWPKSMRWGAASLSTESPRWVRPLQGIVAMLDEEVIELEVGDVQSGAATVGHRFHHPGRITLGGASDYIEKLRACHVIVDQDERARLIRDGAAAAAAEAGLALVPDEGLVEENAGLTEWPVPLLGSFDEAFLQVPREVIQLTMRTNQKYFALLQSSPERGGGPPAKPVVEGAHGGASPEDKSEGGEAGPLHHPPAAGGPPPRAGEDRLAPAFICVANIAARDGGARIVEGNQKVLAARLSDARFFWEQDLRVPLEDQAKKLSQIVFHEKLGTIADKVERVAKLARWLVVEGIVASSPSPVPGEGASRSEAGEGLSSSPSGADPHPPTASRRAPPSPVPGKGRERLANLAERAARLCKADLVTQMVGEFPELQGLIGGYLAAAQGEDPQVAEAIHDHYKPVGQGDEVPTAPVTVAVSLADKLDTLVQFFGINEKPTGSKDPFALRRAAVAVLQLTTVNSVRLEMRGLLRRQMLPRAAAQVDWPSHVTYEMRARLSELFGKFGHSEDAFARRVDAELTHQASEEWGLSFRKAAVRSIRSVRDLLDFFADRLKVQQREAGVRHDLIDAVFALGGEDDLVRLLSRVRALQAFVETQEGADLLAGYKRAANILKKEGFSTSLEASGEKEGAHVERSRDTPPPTQKVLSYTPETEETALIYALDAAEPRAAAAIEQEDFEAAMAALATLRAPIDAFFEKVTVNDLDQIKRAARLSLLSRIRNAVHQVADFSKIEG